MMTMATTRVTASRVRVGWLLLATMAVIATGARAQTVEEPGGAPAAPNTGRLAFTGNFDVASAYVFRGILQDDEGFIAWPTADVGVTLGEGDGAVKKVAVNFGTWNSLHSGPTGSDGPSGKLWYESDFYTSLTVGLGGGFSVGTIYTAYTSPNSAFGTVKEIAIKLAMNDASALGPYALSPYALVAFELDGQADGGHHHGTYMELGIAPALPVVENRLTLTLPVKLGLSLDHYYEGPSADDTFGYLDTGIVATTPLSFIPSRFGAWSVHGGVSLLTFGANPKAVNDGDRTKVVGLFGAGLSY
jgi:hypothetical protein